MSVQKIARRDSGYAVVSIVPDFCFVPWVVPPVPFPLSTNLGSAQKTAKKVHLNGKPAFVHDASAAPRTFGDQPGGRKGVISRMVGAKAWSKQHSSSVRIHKHKIVRTGDFFHMNGKFSKRLNQNVCLSCKQAVARMKPPIPT
ncbi:PAAR-like domain-containing protein [Neisseria sp. Marseille-Q2251]|uniref:PAAR-like domain-containing protein n=1 Tax=Neisseria sp. Marseille-Q2251 TaxID=2866585 RepID=UPI003138828D